MYISTSNQERFKVVHSLTMPILAMHLIGNSTCLSVVIQDHYGPVKVIVLYVESPLNEELEFL